MSQLTDGDGNSVSGVNVIPAVVVLSVNRQTESGQHVEDAGKDYQSELTGRDPLRLRVTGVQ